MPICQYPDCKLQTIPGGTFCRDHSEIIKAKSPHFQNTTLPEMVLPGSVFVEAKQIGIFKTFPFLYNPEDLKTFRFLGWENVEDIDLIPGEVVEKSITQIPHPSNTPTFYGKTPEKVMEDIFQRKTGDFKEIPILNDTFNSMYPQNMTPGMIELTNVGNYVGQNMKSIYKDQVGDGAKLKVNRMAFNNFIQEIQNKSNKGVGVLVVFNRRYNALWFQGKTVWRYEPFIPNEDNQQEQMRQVNGALKSFIERHFPNMTFYPYVSSAVFTITNVPEYFKNEFFTYYASLLYLTYRIKNINHEQTSLRMSIVGPKIIDELKLLFLDLEIKARKME